MTTTAKPRRNPRISKRELYEAVPFEEQVIVFNALKQFALGPAASVRELSRETQDKLVAAFDLMDRYAR